ncbi:MAG: tryptophan 2,3-dioxygenase family protein [Acidobacteriota bacterium]
MQHRRMSTLTYTTYLAIDELLALQRPRSAPDGDPAHGEHDELLFIIIHQVYELWFRQLLHEFDHLAVHFDDAAADPPDHHLPAIRATLHRVRTIWKTMVAQVDVLETMTPMSFNAFRTRLEASSGFQSVQFREVEFVLGLRSDRMVAHHAPHPAAAARLRQRQTEPSLYQRFLGYLVRIAGSAIPAEVLVPYADGKPPAHDDVAAALLQIYRENDRLAMVCERLVDLDEGIQEWRYRHVKMVERTIGNKPGTGGSSGVDYLRSTLFDPLFPDLWSIRAQL